MIIPLSIIAALAVIVFLVTSKISASRITEINALEHRKRAALERFDSMVNQRRELKKEIEDKERQAATLRNSQHGGIKTVSASDLDIEEIDDNEKVSRYLLQEGKLSLEQNETVLQKMGLMQMDYIGACLALGFIDLETAKKAIKINKITTKSASLK